MISRFPPFRTALGGLLVAVAVLSSCAPAQRWTKPGVEGAEAVSAQRDCRRWADKIIAPSHMAYDPGSGPLGEVYRSKDRDRLKSLVTRCMRSKGYEPIDS